MTSISSANSGSTALVLLQQTRRAPLSRNGQEAASSTILDTTSVDKDAVIANIKRLATAWQARRAAQAAGVPSQAATGGTVSAAASSAWKSGMATVGAAEIGAGGNSITGTESKRTIASAEAVAFRPLAPSLDNAVAATGGLVRQIIRHNAQFHLQDVPTREEWNASVMEGNTYRLSRGQDPDRAKVQTEFALSDQGYQNRVIAAEETNQAMLSNAKDAPEAINNAKRQLSSVFGAKVQIDYDSNGEMRLGAFDIYYSNGRKMLSYGEDGSMTTYNQDGSALKTLSHSQVATLGYY